MELPISVETESSDPALFAHGSTRRKLPRPHVAGSMSGGPRVVLPRLADRLNIGLIVMGTVARTGLSGLIMGNTAGAILRSVECSVLAVKPEGFETPVKPARHRS